MWGDICWLSHTGSEVCHGAGEYSTGFLTERRLSVLTNIWAVAVLILLSFSFQVWSWQSAAYQMVWEYTSQPPLPALAMMRKAENSTPTRSRGWHFGHSCSKIQHATSYCLALAFARHTHTSHRDKAKLANNIILINTDDQLVGHK